MTDLTGQENSCFSNAHAYKELHPESLTVPGWLVTEYDRTATADFIQHWWNFHDGQHIDTTPFRPSVPCEYILDPGLYEFATKNYDSLTTLLA